MLGDAGLADLDAELEKLSMDLGAPHNGWPPSKNC
jgi:hypothetical protein